ncbi:hypothetical protein KP509_23G050300 [Ceratopteris richardii]|uniref:Rieske domain-containing protein n=1 Tax=Ceratopteris richardii TaxID=49495 RepID=A0A8T2RZP9_CERRI|nr:hypothetical protein KP509_23G050300 [Ceratopteris richardii]
MAVITQSHVALSSTLTSSHFHGASRTTTLFPLRLPKAKERQLSTLKSLPEQSHSVAWSLQATAESATHESIQYDQNGSVEAEAKEAEDERDLFDWYAQWYPVAVVDNLDKRVPHAVTIIGKDLVVWWDRNEERWQVWEDKCPHRLAPLSEGRINEKGELQCSYHGWCFSGCSGSCTFIPQAPLDGAPVWKSNCACASIYPSAEQEGLIWFWPDSRAELRSIAERKGPPSIPALADPTFKDELHSRDLPYGYEQLIENLMDPAHVPFAHHGLQGSREKARPLNYKVGKIEKTGYLGEAENGPATFTAPCIFTLDAQFSGPKNAGGSAAKPAKRIILVFICIPVSPGQSKVIWSFRRNFSFWIEPLIPRWVIHLRQMLVLDSDLYLLHLTERKLIEAEKKTSWEKACYVPTTSDAFVIAFRKWLKNFAGGGPNWGGQYGQLPPTPPKEQLMDRYWSHVKQCRHCSTAMRVFQGAEVFFQALSIAIASVLGVAAIKPIPQLRSYSTVLVVVAIASSILSKWLSHFVYKTYRFHDYNHALVK